MVRLWVTQSGELGLKPACSCSLSLCLSGGKTARPCPWPPVQTISAAHAHCRSSPKTARDERAALCAGGAHQPAGGQHVGHAGCHARRGAVLRLGRPSVVLRPPHRLRRRCASRLWAPSGLAQTLRIRWFIHTACLRPRATHAERSFSGGSRWDEAEGTEQPSVSTTACSVCVDTQSVGGLGE